LEGVEKENLAAFFGGSSGPRSVWLLQWLLGPSPCGAVAEAMQVSKHVWTQRYGREKTPYHQKPEIHTVGSQKNYTIKKFHPQEVGCGRIGENKMRGELSIKQPRGVQRRKPTSWTGKMRQYHNANLTSPRWESNKASAQSRSLYRGLTNLRSIRNKIVVPWGLFSKCDFLNIPPLLEVFVSPSGNSAYLIC